MELKLSCADFTFPLLPHDDVLKLIAMMGFQGVDIGLFEDRSHIYPSHVMPNMAASARDLTSRVQDKGLEIADVYFQASGPGLPALAINHPDAERAPPGARSVHAHRRVHAALQRHPYHDRAGAAVGGRILRDVAAAGV